MIQDQTIEHLIRHELKDILPNVIWQNDTGDYEIFGRYTITKKKPKYEVWIGPNYVGAFNNTKTALSWCIADKYNRYNLAKELLIVDTALGNLSNDIFIRASIATRSKNLQLKEDIEVKLETKILKKKMLENQLAKCVNSAKYLQQRGFINETARIGRTTKNQTSR